LKIILVPKQETTKIKIKKVMRKDMPNKNICAPVHTHNKYPMSLDMVDEGIIVNLQDIDRLYKNSARFKIQNEHVQCADSMPFFFLEANILIRLKKNWAKSTSKMHFAPTTKTFGKMPFPGLRKNAFSSAFGKMPFSAPSEKCLFATQHDHQWKTWKICRKKLLSAFVNSYVPTIW